MTVNHTVMKIPDSVWLSKYHVYLRPYLFTQYVIGEGTIIYYSTQKYIRGVPILDEKFVGQVK